MSPVQIAEAAGIGLAAGVIGGLAGIGGSLVMIPGLVLAFGYRDAQHTDHHLYMAAAMIVNVLVALPATRRHATAGAVRWELVAKILPPMVIGIIAGVLVSDRMPAQILKDGLAVFIAAYCVNNIYRVFRPRPQENRPAERTSAPLMAAIGGGAGMAAGILGIGGGALMVPAMNIFARLRLLQAIGTSSATMVVSAAIGSALKTYTLSAHGLSWREAAWLAAAMAPGAMLGGFAGALLAHRLPLKVVRVAISIILLLVAARLVMPSV